MYFLLKKKIEDPNRNMWDTFINFHYKFGDQIS